MFSQEGLNFKKVVLLEKIKENRKEHRKIFLEALDGYKTKIVELLEQNLEEAKNGKNFDICINLSKPMDRTKDYNRIIGMLELCEEEEITLTEHEFAKYIMDEWDWKDQFLTSNAIYSRTAYQMSQEL